MNELDKKNHPLRKKAEALVKMISTAEKSESEQKTGQVAKSDTQSNVELNTDTKNANNPQKKLKGLNNHALIHELRVHQLELEIQNEELQLSQVALQQTKNRYFELYHFAPMGYCTVDEHGSILEANKTFSELLNRPLIEVLSHPITEFIHYLDQDIYYLCWQQDTDNPNQKKSCELRIKRTQTDYFWARVTLVKGLDNLKNPIFRLILDDISEQKETDTSLELASTVFKPAREAIMVTDSDNKILSINPTFTEITGYTAPEVIGKNPSMLSSGEHSISFYQKLWKTLNLTGRWQGEMINRRKNGDLFSQIMHITTVQSAKGVIENYVALFNDNTAIKKQQTLLESLAYYDPLTGLANRVLMADRLNQAMIQARRDTLPIAVVFLDIDGFKSINDVYGHDHGDQVLAHLAKNIQTVIREGDTLARIGGDEFVVVFNALQSLDSSLPLLNRLLDVASQPVEVDSKTSKLSASLGVTFYPQASQIDADHLLRQADQAMYQAKLLGKNRYELFNIEQNKTLRAHYEILKDFEKALTNNEFILFYQPKINLLTGQLIGVEALIRWRHPLKGLLSPIEFLPAIETHPLAIKLGEWVLDQALKQMHRWAQQNLQVSISVNISAQQLMKPNFVGRLKSILNRHPNVPHHQLEIEILETSKLEDMTQTSHIILQCKKLGVSFALDDFGTGYASLTYLKQLPISLIKIDQSFIKGIMNNVKDLRILEGVISLASALKQNVLAEGIETVEQGEILLQLGCCMGQGYAIAPPMQPENLPNWLSKWQLPPSWKNTDSKTQEQLPLLFASIEHRAWVLSVQKYVKSNPLNATPPLSAKSCRFGEWLDTLGQSSYGTHPRFLDIKAWHHTQHTLVEAMINAHQKDDKTLALKYLSDFNLLSKKVFNALKLLS